VHQTQVAIFSSQKINGRTVAVALPDKTLYHHIHVALISSIMGEVLAQVFLCHQ